VVDDAIAAVAPYAVDGNTRVSRALDLEKEGYDTGLYVHGKADFWDTNGNTGTDTHTNFAVDKDWASKE
jgi:hypothetical protein